MDALGQDKPWFEQALVQQFRSNSRLFYRLAFSIVRSVSAAEDACQQALLKALEQRGQIAEEHGLRAWLARTVVNEAFLTVRRRGVEQRALGRIARERECSWPEEEQLAQRELVLAGLEQVEEPARTILVLRVIRRMPGNEVAALLGWNAAKVSRHLHLGLAQLRQAIEHLGERRTHSQLKARELVP